MFKWFTSTFFAALPQGFTRPKVLILLPMRNVAFNVVRRLVALAQRGTRADSVQVGKVGGEVAWHVAS